MSFQNAAGTMGWTPDVFWRATPVDFWRHWDGFSKFHGGKSDNDNLPDPDVIADMMDRFPDGPVDRSRRVITDAREMKQRMGEALGN